MPSRTRLSAFRRYLRSIKENEITWFVPVRLIQPKQFRRRIEHTLLGGFAIALLTFSGYRFHFNTATAVLLDLLVIVLQSLVSDFVPSAIVAVTAAACLDFFYFPPLLSFRIRDPVDVLAFLVFLATSLVVTGLVSKTREAARRAQRHSTELEQLYEVSQRLLLVNPDEAGSAPVLKVFREVLSPAAVCLFDASTAELAVDGVSQNGLPERTRQAYVLNKHIDDEASEVFVRCLRIGSKTTGALGFEGLLNQKAIASALSVLAAAALERAHIFRRASHQAAAAEAEALRTAILDALAHEFKTPLATILAVIGGIREARNLEPEYLEMADMIEFEASRLSRLTTRLLLTARLDREELRPRMKPVNISQLVERVFHRYTAQTRERHVKVSYYCEPTEVQADRQLLDLALTQLLDNAFKYSPPGSAVTASVGSEAGFITIRVRNEGSVIAPDEQERIFERFYRGTGVRGLVSGTGLGLYVARKIAAAHGGRLDLDKDASREGVVFCLRLPTSNNGSNSFHTTNSYSAC